MRPRINVKSRLMFSLKFRTRSVDVQLLKVEFLNSPPILLNVDSAGRLRYERAGRAFRLDDYTTVNDGRWHEARVRLFLDEPKVALQLDYGARSRMMLYGGGTNLEVASLLVGAEVVEVNDSASITRGIVGCIRDVRLHTMKLSSDNVCTAYLYWSVCLFHYTCITLYLVKLCLHYMILYIIHIL